MAEHSELTDLRKGMSVRYHNRVLVVIETRPLVNSTLPPQFLHRLHYKDGVERWLCVRQQPNSQYSVAQWTRLPTADTLAHEHSWPHRLVVDRRQYRFARRWGYSFVTANAGRYHGYIEYRASEGSDYIVFVKFPEQTWKAYTGRDIPEAEIVVVG